MTLNIIRQIWDSESNILYKLKSIPRIFKFCIQRITKGYSDFDLQDLREFYLKLWSNSLNEFNNITYGHPEYMTNREWHNYLRELSDSFEFAYMIFYENSTSRDDLMDTRTHSTLDKLAKVFIYLWD